MPPMFSVQVDEPIAGGTITLNGGTVPLMKNVDGAYWAKWREAVAEGKITVRFPDGKSVSCGVGYKPGSSPRMQVFAIRDRKCAPLAVS